LSWCLVFVDVDAIVFQDAEESFRSGVVQTLSLAIHGDRGAAFFNQLDIVQIGKMPTLVAVDDLRLMGGNGALQAVQNE